MRDLANHLKKFNRKVIRSLHRELSEEEDSSKGEPFPHRSPAGQRKKMKRELRKERLAHVPTHPSEEERNRAMKKRVPIFDRNTAPPRFAPPTKKKTPRL